MKLLVYMKDGRTVYALRGRGEFFKLIDEKRGPAHQEDPVIVVRGTWLPDACRYRWEPNVRLRYIARNSVSLVEEGDPNQASGGAHDLLMSGAVAA